MKFQYQRLSAVVQHHCIYVFGRVIPPGILKRRGAVIHVEYPARLSSILNLRKGKQFSGLAIVEILPHAIGMFLRIAGLYPHFHIATARPRIVTRELLLVDGGANEIAFKNLLSHGVARGAQATDLRGGRSNDRAIRERPKQASRCKPGSGRSYLRTPFHAAATTRHASIS